MQRYDLAIWGPIRRIAFRKEDDDFIHDIRERSVTFEWEYGLAVAIMLQQSCFYMLSKEIAIKKSIKTLEKQKETEIIGKIIFDDQMAVSMMEGAAKLHDSRLC